MIIRVEDTGIGISKDKQDAVFERFIQADITYNSYYEGSGLGLSIVKAYVEMMDGKISLKSEIGKGSCFTIELPLEIVKKAIVEQIEDLGKRPGIKFDKILIAEDDEISYQHLSIILEPYARQIIRAKNGDEAVRIARENPDLDIILMDIKMPLMDGYEATKIIHEANKDMFIVCQTAYALQDDKDKAEEAGCNAYITKPIDINKLLSIMSEKKLIIK